MKRARKLFPIYGSALANNMLTALRRDRVVDRFVAAYVNEYGREGILGGASRDRELAETIGREVVLAMIPEVRSALPRFFGKKQLAKLKVEEMQAVDAFIQELTAALGRAWSLNADDQRAFRRDLALYADFDAAHPPRMTTRKRAKGNELERPFIGRVALLIDPSMIEQARRASRKFHNEAARLAQKLLQQTLRPS